MKIPRPCPGYTGQWNIDRFRVLIWARGIDPDVPGAAGEIADRMTAARRAVEPDAPVVDRRVCLRWLTGESDPSKPAAGRVPYVFEIALAFDCDPGWLMTGEVEP